MSNHNIEYMDEPSFEVFTEGRMLVALLEMAADAESLKRLVQAEHLYKRAAELAQEAQDQDRATALAILWDLARVRDQQNRSSDADDYDNEDDAGGFLNCGSRRRN